MNDNITTQLCEKTMSGDFTTELSMPDYEPEIRRLLRVEVTLTPPLGFADSNRLGIGGDIIYNIVYAGADGELYSVDTSEKYELTEALKPSEKGAEITGMLCDAVPESVVSRATAPRKISLRCRLRGRARGFCEKELAERSTYIEAPESIERLTGEESYVCLFPSSDAEIRLSDDFPVEFPHGVAGDVRIVSHTAAVVCEEVQPLHGETTVRGFLSLSAVVAADDTEAAPFRLLRRIPFVETVEAAEVVPSCVCVAVGSCVGCDFTVTDDRIACEAVIRLRIDAEEERTAEYTKDLYSTDVTSEVVQKRYEFPVGGVPFSGNFTASVYNSADENTLPSGAEFIDATATASVKNVEHDGKKLVVTGEVAFGVLSRVDGEYTVTELHAPVRYEVDAERYAFSDCTLTAMPPRIKTDGGRLLCDCEVHASGRFFSSSQFEAVDEAIFGEKLTDDGATTVCFPTPTDSVWDIAKRYHVPCEIIEAQEARLKAREPIVF